MAEIPQRNYRNKKISFDQFSDILMIGMEGLTDHLMDKDALPYNVDGMVNYYRVAKNLGLVYDQDWLERFGEDLENHGQQLVSHDLSPEEKIGENDDGGFWVYLNSGFDRIAELLFEKYYKVNLNRNTTYDEFQAIFLAEILGFAESGIDVPENDIFQNRYDLRLLVKSLDLEYSDQWLDKFVEYATDGEFLKKIDGEKSLYALTEKGIVEAKRKWKNIGLDGYLLATQGAAEVYFSVDASHINRLGQELVAKQETAVAELVKNGYDADAQRVELIFKSIDKPGGTLEVFDDGVGMDYDSLVNGFMTISTDDKVTNPLSKKYKRQKAGRKGIGRFAAQRLGKKLVLVTTTEDLNYALKLSINWENFEAKKGISSVPNRIERINKDFRSGTKLMIEDLRDTWSESQIQRSYKHISEIIQPFPLSGQSSEGNDPGFNSTFALEIDDDIKIVADDWSMFFKDALAIIDGYVDAAGNGFWSVRSDTYNIFEERRIGPDKNEPLRPFLNLKNVKFQAYYYIDKELPRASAKRVREKLQESGGIRLYRNGFRVLPYGERYDDWLKLNTSNLMRSILPPHSNRNFLGFVEIKDVGGEQFEETSSREGLLENESFNELKEFISSSIKSAVLPIAEARNKRKTTTETRRERRTVSGRAQEIVEKLNTLKEEAKDNPEHLSVLNAVFSSIGPSITELKDQEELQIEETGMLRVLASLGLTIGEFTHEIALGFENLTLVAQGISSQMTSNGAISREVMDPLLRRLDDIKSHLHYFDRTARENVYREIQPIEIRDVINAFREFIKPRVDRYEIEFSIKVDEYQLFTRPMHKSEWASILINFFTNSLKAIKRKGVKGKIFIRAGRDNGNIFLEFADNGDGIPEKNRLRVFDAFFTTTSIGGVGVDEAEDTIGMGLGLKIVKDIVDSVGGDVEIIDAPLGYSTCIRVEISEAKDVPDDAY